MYNIIGKKKWYFIFSFLIIIPGIISLILYGLNLSIDFTGGSRITLVFEKNITHKEIAEIRSAFESEKVKVSTIQPSGKEVIIRSEPVTEKQDTAILKKLDSKFDNFKQEQFETIGPVIGQETALNALKAIVLATTLILLYLAWSFRKVPRPTSGWRFGVVTVITLIHDIFVLVGIFSLLGHFFDVEVDSLFLTALLTVMGFSVHDTIVVFDRIRENLMKGGAGNFAQTVNDALLQTMTRSLNTSFTTLLVLFTLLLFGGESIRWFVAALLIGIFSGTYSSIFNAAPLLVLWDELDKKRKKK